MDTSNQIHRTRQLVNGVFLRWVILCCIVVSLTGCKQMPQIIQLVESDTTPALETKQTGNRFTIALVMKTLTNPFFAEMERGARNAESELDIQLIVKTAAQETSIDQQIGIVEDLIHQDVDAIVIAPGDSRSLIPVLVKAQAAGIVIVNIDNRLDPHRMEELGLTGVPFISVDNEAAAYLSAKAIAELVQTPAQVAIIEGIRSAENAAARKAGALRAFAAYPEIQVVAMETANWKIDEAYEVAKVLLEQNPEIDGFFCANDMMALGVVRLLEEIGRDDLLVSGFDALQEAQHALDSGKLIATIDQKAAEQGYMGVNYATLLLEGEVVPDETLIEVEVLHAPVRP